jgi:hypothetical protein
MAACAADCTFNGYDFNGDNKCVRVFGTPKGTYTTETCSAAADCDRLTGKCKEGTIYDSMAVCAPNCQPNGFEKKLTDPIDCHPVYGKYAGGYSDDKCTNAIARFRMSAKGNSCEAVGADEVVVAGALYPSAQRCVSMNADKMTANYDYASNSCTVVGDGSGNCVSLAECMRKIIPPPTAKSGGQTVNIVVLSVALGLSFIFLLIMIFMVRGRCA